MAKVTAIFRIYKNNGEKSVKKFSHKAIFDDSLSCQNMLDEFYKMKEFTDIKNFSFGDIWFYVTPKRQTRIFRFDW